MPLYIITILDPSVLHNGESKMLVSAEDLVDAKKIALGNSDSYPAGYWNKATLSAAQVVKADYEGCKMRIRLYDAAGVLYADATSAVGASSETVDGLCAKMVTALNATALANASYSTPTLTVSTIGDAIGDYRLVATLIPAAGEGGDNTTGETEARSVSAIFDAITDQGIAAAAITIAMEVTAVPPKIHAVFGDVEN